MKTHYEPYAWDDDAAPEAALCGTLLGERSEVTASWREVTCIRCLNSRESIDKAIEQHNEAVSAQLGDIAEFMKKQEISHGTNKQCSQWDDKASHCMSGHIRTSSLCWGVANGVAPQCLMDELPAHLINESGMPLAAHVREPSHDNQ